MTKKHLLPTIYTPTAYKVLFLLLWLFCLEGCEGQGSAPPFKQEPSTTATKTAEDSIQPPHLNTIRSTDSTYITWSEKFRFRSFDKNQKPLDINWTEKLRIKSLEKSLDFLELYPRVDNYFPDTNRLNEYYKIESGLEGQVLDVFKSYGIELKLDELKKSNKVYVDYYCSMLGLNTCRIAEKPKLFLNSNETPYQFSKMFTILNVELIKYNSKRTYSDSIIAKQSYISFFKADGVFWASYTIDLPSNALPTGIYPVFSDDEQFIVSSTEYGEDEAWYDGETILYDTKNKKTFIVPKMDENKHFSSPSLEDICFADSLFQINYSSDGAGFQLFINPYKRLTYSRFYESPSFLKIFNRSFGGRIENPILPNGKIRDEYLYEIKSF